jgi:hypothetical protein
VCVRLRRSPRSVDNAVVTGIGWALFGVGAGTLLAIALTSDVGPQNQGVLAEYPEHYNPPPAPVPRRRSPFASNAILRFPARSTLQGYEWPTALGGSSTNTGRLLEPGKWILGTRDSPAPVKGGVSLPWQQAVQPLDESSRSRRPGGQAKSGTQFANAANYGRPARLLASRQPALFARPCREI